MRGRGAALAVLLLLAVGLTGCGGDSGSTTSTARSREEGPRVLPLKVSGGGSAQFRVEGGDNSIANFGAEAPHRELRAAAALAHDYLAALVTEDWAGACRRLSTKVASGVERLAAAVPEFEGKGCSAALAKLIGSVSPAAGRQATLLDAAALRHKGGLSFLIYHGAGGHSFFLKLVREGGDWEVDALSPTALG